MDTLSKLLSEDSGVSCMRVVFLMVTAVVLFNWTWVNIHTGTMTNLDWGAVSAIVGLAGGKAIQKFAENKKIS